MTTGGVEILEHSAEPAYGSFKCRDPDGYVLEVYWGAGFAWIRRARIYE